MVNIRMVPVTNEHVRYIANHMRYEERLETWRSDALRPYDVIMRSLEHSIESYVAVDEHNIPISIFGVCEPQKFEDGNDWWCVWLLSVDGGANEHKFSWYKTCKNYLPYFLLQYPRLFNYIDAKYEESLRWIKHLGFTVGAPEPYGKMGAPFRKVTLTWEQRQS